RALRCARLRQADRVRIPEGEAGLRTVPDRGANPSEHGNLATDIAVEPDGLAGDPRKPARDPDREFDPLRVAAVFAGGAGAFAGAQTGDRRLWRACRHEGDAGRGVGSPLR